VYGSPWLYLSTPESTFTSNVTIDMINSESAVSTSASIHFMSTLTRSGAPSVTEIA
jgi:hypothetical protein